MDIPPNHTLFVNNLNEKVGVSQLKKALYSIFSNYGPILEIVAARTNKKRGQAFIVFKDISSATMALRSLQSFPFYDKPMRIQYSKTKSDAIAKLDGSYVSRENRKSAIPADEFNTNLKDAKMTNAATYDRNTEPNHILFVQNLPEDTTSVKLQMLFMQFPGFREVRVVPGRSDIAFVEFGNDTEAGVARNSLQGFMISSDHSIVISYAKK